LTPWDADFEDNHFDKYCSELTEKSPEFSALSSIKKRMPSATKRKRVNSNCNYRCENALPT